MNSHMVVVSKNFHKPEIHYYIKNDEISLEIKLEDYLQALLAEVGSPLWMLSKKALADKLSAASAIVIQDMKNASVYNPPPLTGV
jgi:hypothetical protein